MAAGEEAAALAPGAALPPERRAAREFAAGRVASVARHRHFPYCAARLCQQDGTGVRRTMTSASKTRTPRKSGLTAPAKAAPKTGAAGKPAPKRAAAPSKAAIMLDDLRSSVDALHDRVEKLRHRFA